MTVARLRTLTRKPTRLQAIANNLLGEVVQVMDRRLDTALKTMQTEPAPKPDSTYVRTHIYARNWRRTDVRLTGAGLVGTISNPVRYALFVGGNEAGLGQVPMHRDTGWPLLAVALRDQRGLSFGREIQKTLHQVIEGA